MIDLFFESFKDILVLIFFSLLLRILLEFSGQRWIKTISHTSTLTILPIVTYFITSVIAGNIALSLGMVGALSIVRFRNPVRSPLELTVYFAAITMGITASIELKWLALLVCSIFFAVFCLYFIAFALKKFFIIDFFITSFSEGNSLSTLEIKSTENITLLDNSNLLKSKHVSENLRKYLLVSNNFQDLRDLCSEIENDSLLIDYQLNE